MCHFFITIKQSDSMITLFHPSFIASKIHFFIAIASASSMVTVGPKNTWIPNSEPSSLLTTILVATDRGIQVKFHKSQAAESKLIRLSLLLMPLTPSLNIESHSTWTCMSLAEPSWTRSFLVLQIWSKTIAFQSLHSPLLRLWCGYGWRMISHYFA